MTVTFGPCELARPSFLVRFRLTFEKGVIMGRMNAEDRGMATKPQGAVSVGLEEVGRPQLGTTPGKRIAIVTGASSGLGREFAQQLDGLQVADELWLVARSQEALADVAAQLDTPARIVVADLASEADIASVRALLASEQPRVTFLVNAAGFGKFGDWQTISDAAVDSMIDLNCRGLVDMTRAALPYMERGGRIIQVASAAAFVPLPHMNVYAATKAFVLRYTRALRWELHGTGITVTALCPTWVKTGFEKVARTSGGGNDVGHLLGAQTPQQVVRRALCANKAHFAVACASPQSVALRLIGKVMPSCITMAGWDVLRRL